MLFRVDSNNTFRGQRVEEAGTYNVEIVKSELKNSSNGNPMINLDYRVLDGTYEGAKIEYADTMTWIDSDPEKLERSIKRFNDLLVKIGIPDGTQVDTIQDYAKGLMGQKLNVTVEWHQSDYGNNAGNYFLRVKYHSKLDPEGSKPNGQKRPESSSNGAGGPQNSKTGNYSNWGQNGSYGQPGPNQQDPQGSGFDFNNPPF